MSVRLSDWRMMARMSSGRLPDKGGVAFLASDAFHSLTKSSVTVHTKSWASLRGMDEKARALVRILVCAAVQREALTGVRVSCVSFFEVCFEGLPSLPKDSPHYPLQTVGVQGRVDAAAGQRRAQRMDRNHAARRFPSVQLHCVRIRTTRDPFLRPACCSVDFLRFTLQYYNSCGSRFSSRNLR